MWRAVARHFSKQWLDSRTLQTLSVTKTFGLFRRSSSRSTAMVVVHTDNKVDEFLLPFGSSILSQLQTPFEEVLDAALLTWLPQQSPEHALKPRFESRYNDRGCSSLDYSYAFASAATKVIEHGEYEHEEIELHGSSGVESVIENCENLETEFEKKCFERRNMQKKRAALYKKQMKIETEAWTDAEAQYRALMAEMCRKKLAPSLPAVQMMFLGWYEPLRDAISEEQNSYSKKEFREIRSRYGPFLCQLPASQLAVITMHSLMALLLSKPESNWVKVTQAALFIGEAVEQEIRINKLLYSKKKKKKKKKALKGNIISSLDSTNAHGANVGTNEEPIRSPEDSSKDVRSLATKLLKRRKLHAVSRILRQASGEDPWGASTYVQVGSRLLELLIETSTVRVPLNLSGDDTPHLQPAFNHTMKYIQTKKRSPRHRTGVIECSPFVLQDLDESAKYVVMPYMPMLVKPKRWKGIHSGGYLVLKTCIMRTRGSEEQLDTLNTTSHKSMSNVFKALDALGETRWRLNMPVFDVIEQLWKEGGGVANLVDASNVLLPEGPKKENADGWKSWKRELRLARVTNHERHSLRCDINLKLSVARNLRGEEFYYPHNLDFRGRAYPMHPNLNHLGSDLCRGMLEFAEGKPLGLTGLRWLKIQLANLLGGSISKLSFDGRVAHIDNCIDQVFESAEQPLDGSRWWIKAEDPFQFLAACMEVRNAIMSGSPETYISFLPIHQDGSCNGLQHYAALGRDRVGGEAVNLIARDKPADVYTSIADRVQQLVAEDASSNPKNSKDAAIAKILLGQIDRKLVKQTVMTSVYGVTFVGARNQVWNRLKERDIMASDDDKDLYDASCYAAKVTLNALGEGFQEARRIMTWLSDCAQVIAQSGNSVKWTTPLGLPVVQPYRTPGRQLVKTSLQDLHLRVSNSSRPVLKSRQRSAFPPNFVHSLDSTHMMMTALACKQASITFAGVHDSYWTHAGDVDRMNRFIRKKFVELYNQPILENLLQEFQDQFPDLNFPSIPNRGELDLRDVLKSPYFFN